MDTYRMRAEAICASCRKGRGPSASWFRTDRTAFWTKRAAALVSRYTEKHPDVDPTVIDRDIALLLRLEATEALLSEARRR